MKATECSGEIIKKNGEKYTKFVIGSKVVNSKIERLIIAIGGNLIKESKRVKHYISKGDWINLCMIC